MEEKRGFGMKDCLSLPGLGWKYFKSLRTEDEPVFVYNDKYMRHFVRERVLKEDEFVLLINIMSQKIAMIF